MHHRARAHNLHHLTGWPTFGPPRGGWRRDDPATGQPHPSPDGAPVTDPATDGGKPADPDGAPTKTPKVAGDFDPDRAMRDLGKARDDAAKAKAAADAAVKGRTELIDTIAVALGLKPDPKTDPNALAAQAAKELTEIRAQAQELRVENALLKLAPKLGADVDALADSRGFMSKLAALDPDSNDFEKQVQEAIKDAVKANPKLAAGTAPGGQGPARQGADHGGGSNGRQRPASLGAALAARMSGTT